MKAALLEPLSTSLTLKDGFWPTSCIQAALVDQLNDDNKDRKEFGKMKRMSVH